MITLTPCQSSAVRGMICKEARMGVANNLNNTGMPAYIICKVQLISSKFSRCPEQGIFRCWHIHNCLFFRCSDMDGLASGLLSTGQDRGPATPPLLLISSTYSWHILAAHKAKPSYINTCIHIVVGHFLFWMCALCTDKIYRKCLHVISRSPVWVKQYITSDRY